MDELTFEEVKAVLTILEFGGPVLYDILSKDVVESARRKLLKLYEKSGREKSDANKTTSR